MATGMEMLLGRMLGGVNIDSIKEQVETAGAHAQAVIADFKQQMNRIEANQQLLYQLMLNAGVIKPIESLQEISDTEIEDKGNSVIEDKTNARIN